MSMEAYLGKIKERIAELEEQQAGNIKKAALIVAESIHGGHLAYFFGSGHSALPCMDIFPRYGSFVGLQPIVDPRLIWFSVVGPGGARELLWIERQEGYVREVLKSYRMGKGDSMVIFSHGGLNAAPVEMALLCKERGLAVIAVTSLRNYRSTKPTHSSGKALADIADVVIDNTIPPEDALVEVDGLGYKVAAGSTVMNILISMCLISEVAKLLVERGAKLDVFVSPNVAASPTHNEQVFEKYMNTVYKKW